MNSAIPQNKNLILAQQLAKLEKFQESRFHSLKVKVGLWLMMLWKNNLNLSEFF
jgi:hypothetical protein